MAWAKGQSGNPDGRPKGQATLITRIREEFGDDTLRILQTFRDLALGKSLANADGTTIDYGEVKASDRVKAGDIVLERVLGKAPQSIDGTLDLGASAEQLALLAALRMTPQERRSYLAQIDAEDARELAAGPPLSDDED